ncbi:hypothetical protein HK099_002747 [Clydaea vesicula]|uniref:Uncharacterized protein n=1 Tax=Clydaea vesicula TaxID=447962 RepID=A0AAD5TSS5_9FUNG|nr:hypothetical protein HK099_002747 [Clydaea vesicula]
MRTVNLLKRITFSLLSTLILALIWHELFNAERAIKTIIEDELTHVPKANQVVENDFKQISQRNYKDTSEEKFIKPIDLITNLNYQILEEFKYFNDSDEFQLDLRFADLNVYRDYKKRSETLMEISKNYFEFSKKIDFISWLAHKNLLSWHFNKKVFPWEEKLNFQTSFKEIEKLLPYNQTKVGKNGRYLLDLNPYYNKKYEESKKPKDRLNKVDGRFIDTYTGLFLDLSVVTNLKNEFKDFELEDIPDFVTFCKTPHYYTYDDIFPLINTTFNGIEGFYRPHYYMDILKKEFGPNLIDKVHNNFKFDDGKMEWIELKIDDVNGEL